VDLDTGLNPFCCCCCCCVYTSSGLCILLCLAPLCGVILFGKSDLDMASTISANTDYLKQLLKEKCALNWRESNRLAERKSVPTSDAVLQQLSSAVKFAKDRKTKLLVYYVGHGTPNGELILANNELMNVEGLLRHIPFDIPTALVLDCCFSGKSKAVVQAQHIVARGNVQVLMSSAPQEVSDVSSFCFPSFLLHSFFLPSCVMSFRF
jgi:hypothetical protein